jgi:hypothetical protein
MHLIFVFPVINVILCQQSKSQKYSVEKNMNINSNVDPTCLLQSFQRKTKMSCMAQCNLNNECFSIISNSEKNCFLYKKRFDSTELTETSNSDLYT